MSKDRQAAFREARSHIETLLHSFRIEDVARHNAGYLQYDQDRYHYFVSCELGRFEKALDLIESDGRIRTICDLGTFIPFLPVVLSLLGYRVKVADRYDLYGDGFRREIEKVASKTGLELHNIDIVKEDFGALGAPDAVLLMAVVEHLNGSPLNLLEKARGLLSPEGAFIFEVPNIAEFTKRLQFLIGRSPLPGYSTYLESAYPFFGHNREMTVGEVQALLQRAGFIIEHLECYDYCRIQPSSWSGRLALLLRQILPLKDKGQSIIAKAKSAPGTAVPASLGPRSD